VEITAPENKVYVVGTKDSLSMISCSSKELADGIAKELEEVLKSKPSIVLSKVNRIDFDEGRVDVKQKDHITIPLENYDFTFFVPDLTSLYFELYNGLNASYDESVLLVCRLREIVISKAEAVTILDFLEAKRKFFKKKEDAWFKAFDEVKPQTSLKKEEIN